MTCLRVYHWLVSGCIEDLLVGVHSPFKGSGQPVFLLLLGNTPFYKTKYTHLHDKQSCLWVYFVLLMGV